MDADELTRKWNDPAVCVVSYNAGYELVWLGHLLGYAAPRHLRDPMVAAHLLDENAAGRGLEPVALRSCGAQSWKGSWEPYRKALSGLTYFPEEYRGALETYNKEDLYWTRKLDEHLMPLIDAAGLRRLFDVEMENLKTFARMTLWGMRIDVELLTSWEREYQRRRDDLLASFPFNPNSQPQVLAALRHAGVHVRSTGAEALAGSNSPLALRLLEYRQAQKVLSTYLSGLRKHVYMDGRIHPTYHLCRTVSGRTSSSEPNGQNFPRCTHELAFRQLFRGTWECILRLDFNQLELRIAAHYGGGRMLDVYRAGEDIHSITGERIWAKRREQITENERVVSKITNFTCVYDPFASAVGAVRIQCESAGIHLSWGDAADIVESFRRTYPEWWGYYARALRQVYDTGSVRSSAGRIRRSPLPQGILFPFGPPPTSSNRRFFDWCKRYDDAGKKLEQEVLRSIVNSLVQGLGADIVKLACTIVDRRLVRQGVRSRLCNNIHDEILVDTHPDERVSVAQTLREVSCSPPVRTAFGCILRCPLEAETGAGPTWSDAKKKENRLT